MSHSIIEQIHAGDIACVLVAAGGGASAITELLAVPGASSTLLAAHVPYAGEAMTAYLGHEVERSASGKTSRELAMQAWQEARRLRPDSKHVIGIGCTAAFATTRDRRGRDRCHIALQGERFTTEVALTFNKAAHTRASEEQLAAAFIVAELASVAGIEMAPPGLQQGDDVVRHHHDASDEEHALMLGQRHRTGDFAANLVFPGAFHPIHHGHVEMATCAERIVGVAPTLEISITNVDKPPIDYVEMAQRAAAIHHEFQLVYTRAPTFVEKANLFPGATFIVGVDTITRIAETRYYNNSLEERDAALAHFAQKDVNFLVFGRDHLDGFLTLADVELPAALADRCRGVSEADFRRDVSSTEIRTAIE